MKISYKIVERKKRKKSSLACDAGSIFMGLEKFPFSIPDGLVG
jgi:hypothetical protein